MPSASSSGSGRIEPLLDDDEVSEIRVFGHDIGHRRSRRRAHRDRPALLERSGALPRHRSPVPTVAAAARRPAKRSSSGTCRAGFLVHAVLPPTSQYGHALVIESGVAPKRRSTIWCAAAPSRARWRRSFAVARRRAQHPSASVLRTERDALVGPRVGRAADRSHRRAASVDELWGLEPEPIAIRLPDSPEEASKLVRAAAKLRPDRLVVSPMRGPGGARRCSSAIAEGCEGVLATVAAPSLRHALERLVSDLMAARPGITLEAAKSWLLGSFELAVEIARLRDGRYRVMRIAELVADEAGVDRARHLHVRRRAHRRRRRRRGLVRRDRRRAARGRRSGRPRRPARQRGLPTRRAATATRYRLELGGSGPLLQLAQREAALQRAHVIDHQHAVQVIVLVLDGDGEQALGRELERLAVARRWRAP